MFILIATLFIMPADAPVIAFQKVVQKYGRNFMQFQVENTGKQAIHFVGYTPESFSDGIPAGEIRPMYTMEVRQAKGDWKPLELGHCGTGRGVLAIEAKSKVIFETVLPESDWDELRVGFAWSSAPQGKGTILWSQPIKRETVIGKSRVPGRIMRDDVPR